LIELFYLLYLMNTLVIFIALLLAIIIFFLLYCLQYKKLNKQIESFECTSDQNNIFYIEIDNEQQACFNYVTELYSSNDVGNEFTLYNFNGQKSYAYVRDFLDNFFNISLVVIFKDVSKTTPQTLIHTKFLLVELNGTELSVTYDKYGVSQQEKIFANIEKDEVYQLKIEQHFDFKEVSVTFDKYINFDETTLNSHNFELSQLQSCRYSSGNDFCIGCNKNKEQYLNSYIGDITLKFDKKEFDKYDYPGVPIPSDLECDVSNVQPETTDSVYKPTTQIAGLPFDNLEDYISINIGNQFNDLKITYFDPQGFDDTFDEINEPNAQIQDYFSTKLKLEQSIFTNVQSIIMEKNNGFFNGYDNLRNYKSENIYYLFSLQNEANINILSKFSFLDLLYIKEKYDTFDETFIFIYGHRPSEKTFHKFLNINKPIFFMIFKNSNDQFFQFEQIKINLSNFYDIQRKYLEELVRQDDKSNSIENYINFIKSLNTHEIITIDQELTDDDKESKKTLEYDRNIFRLYDSRIDFSSIDVNIYKNTVLSSVVYVKYKSELLTEECNFVPKGETNFECIQECINSDYYTCRDIDCKSLCNNCNNVECKWNILDIERQKMFVPTQVKLKGFSGDKKIKLTWIKPMSEYKLTGYFIIVENEVKQNRFDMYVYNGEEEMVEFVISGLENSLPHSFYVFTKNSQGVSDPSNRVTLIPKKNKLLDMENISSISNTYSDSLQNYYKTIENNSSNVQVENIDKQIRNMDYLIETNKLKEILVDKIVTSKINNLNVNIF
jgi:hypothetical protein